MKPLLIILPAAARWPALESLLRFLDPTSLDDLRRRVVEGAPDAFDAVAIMPEGSRAVAHAGLIRRRDRAVLRHVWTSPEHRRRGYARRLLTTLVTWFDMSGGRLIYACGPEDLAVPLLGPTGFAPLHRAEIDTPRVVLARGQLPESPMEAAVKVRSATAADFALLVEFFQFFPGGDPLVPLHDSAAMAETTVQQMLAGTPDTPTRTLLSLKGPRVIGVARITRPVDGPVHIRLMPHAAPPEELRKAAESLAGVQPG